MKCPFCGKESSDYNSIVGMYHCEDCGKYFDEDTDPVKEEYEIRWFDVIMMCIPIVNIIYALTLVSSNSNRNGSRLFVSANIIAQLVSTLIVTLILAIIIKSEGISLMTMLRNIGRESILQNYEVDRLVADDIIPETDFVLPDKDEFSNYQKIVSNNSSKVFTEESIGYMDNSTLSGSGVLSVMLNYTNYTYLIHTKAIDDKYGEDGKDLYFAFGISCKEFNLSPGNEFMSGHSDLKVIKQDAHTYIKIDEDQMTSERYLFNIYKTRKYNVKILKNSWGDIVGLAFTEVVE